MRTLLLTGPKGGTGKTTTAINLAAIVGSVGRRVLLVDADPGNCAAYFLHKDPASSGLPDPITDVGLYWPSTLPNVDLITPYPLGSSSQNQLEHFLKGLTEWADEEQYKLVLLDAPPMLGARAKALYRTADEVLLILRADALSFQLLPAYLELAKREAPTGKVARFLGILMTLGTTQKRSDPTVEALQARFKGILPQMIPHDPDNEEAVISGIPLALFKPYSPATKAYRELAQTLRIIRRPNPSPTPDNPESGSSPSIGPLSASSVLK